MRERVTEARRWLRRLFVSMPLLALPGPCTTFDDEEVPSAEGDSGTADATPPVPPALLELTDAVRACSLVARCPSLQASVGLSLAIPVAAGEFGSCVQMLAGPMPPSRPGLALAKGVLTRVAAARSCQEALDAMPVELLYGADERCPEASSPRCRGETHVAYCDRASGFGRYARCSADRGGPTCVAIEVDGGATVSGCGILPEPGTCDGFVHESECQGTAVYSCDPRDYKVATRFDCAWLGLRCGASAKGGVTCLTSDGSDLPCTTLLGSSCEGARVRFCVEPGRYSTFDCGEIGATCVGGADDGSAGPRPFCLRRGAECSPLDPSVGSCDGSTIELCVDGRRARFDCARAGKQCDRAKRACL